MGVRRTASETGISIADDPTGTITNPTQGPGIISIDNASRISDSVVTEAFAIFVVGMYRCDAIGQYELSVSLDVTFEFAQQGSSFNTEFISVSGLTDIALSGECIADQPPRVENAVVNLASGTNAVYTPFATDAVDESVSVLVDCSNSPVTYSGPNITGTGTAGMLSAGSVSANTPYSCRVTATDSGRRMGVEP